MTVSHRSMPSGVCKDERSWSEDLKFKPQDSAQRQDICPA